MLRLLSFRVIPCGQLKLLLESSKRQVQQNSPFSATGRMIFKQSLPKVSKNVKLKRTEALQKTTNEAKLAFYEMDNDPEIYQPYLEKYRAKRKGTVSNSTNQPGHLLKNLPSHLSPDIGNQSSDLSIRLTQTQREFEAVKANLREEISRKVSDRINNQLPHSAESIISDVYDSLMVEYSPKFDFIEKQLKSLKNSFMLLEERVKKIENRLVDIEQEDRLNSLIFSGVKQALGADVKSCINSIISDKMGVQVTVSELTKVYRFTLPANSTRPDMIAPVFAQFSSKDVAGKVFAAKSKLAKSVIFVSESSIKKRREILQLARDRLGNHNVWSDHGRIFARSGTDTLPRRL